MPRSYICSLLKNKNIQSSSISPGDQHAFSWRSVPVPCLEFVTAHEAFVFSSSSKSFVYLWSFWEKRPFSLEITLKIYACKRTGYLNSAATFTGSLQHQRGRKLHSAHHEWRVHITRLTCNSAGTSCRRVKKWTAWGFNFTCNLAQLCGDWAARVTNV